LEEEKALRRHEVVKIDNEFDIDECFTKVRSKIWEKKREGYDVWVDFTSGTKPMSSGALIAAAQELLHVSYVMGKREEGRLVGTMKPYIYEMTEAARSILEMEISSLFNSHQFYACERLIEGWKETISNAELRLKFVKGYYYWDIFRHDGARELLINLRAVPPENREFLGKVKERIDYQWVDILANAERRAEEGRFDEGVARLYNLVQRVAHERLRSKYNIDPSVQRMGLWDSLQKLKELGDELGMYADDGEIVHLMQARNQSPLAHGIEPVKEEVYEKFHEKVEGILKSLDVDLEAIKKKCTFPKWEDLIRGSDEAQSGSPGPANG
jgi:hypothetical protein